MTLQRMRRIRRWSVRLPYLAPLLLLGTAALFQSVQARIAPQSQAAAPAQHCAVICGEMSSCLREAYPTEYEQQSSVIWPACQKACERYGDAMELCRPARAGSCQSSLLCLLSKVQSVNAGTGGQ
ncbi:MAG: hypothetical protein K1X75_01245 [Leptospirales bacterium]|nr:hypothetical protein [Leptospirales bacterium]